LKVLVITVVNFNDRSWLRNNVDQLAQLQF
jgi:hypothetical protein